MARPFPLRRLAAGALAGLLAGLVLHVIMAPTGAFEAMAARTPMGTVEAAMAWQMGTSLLLGLLFAALPVAGWPRGIGLGLLYGAAVWLVVDWVGVRTWAGLPVAIDTASLMGLGGRLVWGLALGLAFVGLMVALFRAREARRRVPV